MGELGVLACLSRRRFSEGFAPLTRRHILQVSFKSRTSDFQSDNGMAEFLTCSNFYLFSIIYGKVYTATKTVVVSSNTTLVITTYRDGWFDSTASHQFLWMSNSIGKSIGLLNRKISVQIRRHLPKKFLTNIYK